MIEWAFPPNEEIEDGKGNCPRSERSAGAIMLTNKQPARMVRDLGISPIESVYARREVLMKMKHSNEFPQVKTNIGEASHIPRSASEWWCYLGDFEKMAFTSDSTIIASQ